MDEAIGEAAMIILELLLIGAVVLFVLALRDAYEIRTLPSFDEYLTAHLGGASPVTPEAVDEGGSGLWYSLAVLWGSFAGIALLAVITA